MQIRQLKYFVTLAEELHFGRAAYRLHISQPPLSQQIKSLEEEIGIVLFERNRRTVELTPGGRVFLEHAYRILQDINAAVSSSMAIQQGEAGSLHIGCSRSALYSGTLLRCFSRFHADYPNIEISLYEDSTSEQVKNVLDQRIDIAIVRGLLPPIHQSMLKIHINTEKLVAVVPPMHHLAKERQISAKALKEENFVLFAKKSATALNELILNILAKEGIVPRVSVEVISMSGILGLVGAGLGVSIVPETVVKSHHSPVVMCLLKEPHAKIDLNLITKKKHSEVIKNFINLLKEEFAC